MIINANKPIFCIVGESGAGKSTYLDLTINNKELNVKELKYYTTRSKRCIEEDSYYFVDESKFKEELEAGNIIEYRKYSKYDEDVIYFTTYDNINIDDCDALVCAASVDQILAYIEKLDNVYIIDIKVELKERLKRLLGRANSNNEVLEICRRTVEEQNEYAKLESIDKNIIHIYNDNTQYKFSNHGDMLYNLITTSNLKIISDYIKNHI